MGTLLMLLGLGGVGGLGWWLAHDRSHDEGGAPTPDAPNAPNASPVAALPPPAASSDVPPPPWPAPPPAPALPAPRSVAASVPPDFVPRLRGWLEQGPPATQIELVASHVERAGLHETAAGLRVLAANRRRGGSAEPPDAQADGREERPPGPPEPASPPPAPDGSPDSSPGSASDRSPSTGESNEASSTPSGSSDGARADARTLRRLARRVAAMLNARRGQSTDRRLVRAFQVAARVFPERGETPSGLYGPATRAALARFVRRPPRPRFRAEVEARPPRRPTPRRASSRHPSPNTSAR